MTVIFSMLVVLKLAIIHARSYICDLYFNLGLTLKITNAHIKQNDK